jgi:hypothetical protein
MEKQLAINNLSRLIDELNMLPPFIIGGSRIGFDKWHKDVELALRNIYKEEDDKHFDDFMKLSFFWTAWRTPASDDDKINYHNTAREKANSLLQAYIDEIKSFWIDDVKSQNTDSASEIKLLCDKFHGVARQLQIRHSGRETINIKDEYDVQDLMSGLLKIYFSDIRQEEYTPSYAGGASRIDFLINDGKIALEIKKTRNTLTDKELGAELLIDIQRYRSHPNVKKLICFIYDPDGFIRNPNGLIEDLKVAGQALLTEVIIVPKY